MPNPDEPDPLAEHYRQILGGLPVIHVSDLVPPGTAYLASITIDRATGMPRVLDAVRVENIGQQ